jgi:hypothetical protein
MHQAQRGAAQFKRLIAGHVGTHLLETGKVRPEHQEFLRRPRAGVPQHADLFFVRDRERCEQQGTDDAENRGGAGGAKGKREDGEQRVRRPRRQPARRIPQVHDPTLHGGSS